MTAPLVFFFGRTPELSIVELQEFVSDIESIADGIVMSSHTEISHNGKVITPEELILVLGGTVKIGSIIGTLNDIDAVSLIPLLSPFETKDKWEIAVSGYGCTKSEIQQINHDMKKILLSEGKSVRFVLPQDGSVVSAVAITKNHLSEYSLVKKNDGTFFVVKTEALQPFEFWNKRDYDRPCSDAKSGMLPPKVSRMVVNIALGNDARGKILLDPFCGMGTILGEAMSRGVNTIGVDISAEAIAKAKKNCSWLLHEWSLPTTAQCIVGDATQLSTMKEIQHIDAIATEPYLGTTKLGEGKITDAKRIKDIIKGLEYLYIGCLRDWQGILKPHARVVMAIPSYTIGDRTYAVKKVVDTCENLGYTKLLGPIQYGRPKSIVQRNFYIFERK